MNKEGSVLINHLTRAIIGPAFDNADAPSLTLKTCTALMNGEYDDSFGERHNALGVAGDIIAAHGAESQLTELTIERATDTYLSGKYESGTLTPSMLQALVTRYTYEATLGRIMNEAYLTMLYFPINLLNTAQYTTSRKFLPPVCRSFEDIPRIYRSDWFQDACNTAAVPANTLWKEYSGQLSHAPLGLAASYMHLEFELDSHGLSTFRFANTAIQGFRKHLRTNNQEVIRAHSADREAGLPARPESFGYGTSSGCPVRHGKPGLNPNKPDELNRLQIIAEFVGLSPEELANQRSGINYGLNAMADMFERCIPPINEALEKKRRGIW